jgi:hypothetical protein
VSVGVADPITLPGTAAQNIEHSMHAGPAVSGTQSSTGRCAVAEHIRSLRLCHAMQATGSTRPEEVWRTQVCVGRIWTPVAGKFAGLCAHFSTTGTNDKNTGTVPTPCRAVAWRCSAGNLWWDERQGACLKTEKEYGWTPEILYACISQREIYACPMTGAGHAWR